MRVHNLPRLGLTDMNFGGEASVRNLHCFLGVHDDPDDRIEFNAELVKQHYAAYVGKLCVFDPPNHPQKGATGRIVGLAYKSKNTMRDDCRARPRTAAPFKLIIEWDSVECGLAKQQHVAMMKTAKK